MLTIAFVNLATVCLPAFVSFSSPWARSRLSIRLFGRNGSCLEDKGVKKRIGLVVGQSGAANERESIG
jgi:hypothetical protein